MAARQKGTERQGRTSATATRPITKRRALLQAEWRHLIAKRDAADRRLRQIESQLDRMDGV